MPAPTADQINALIERLREQITNGVREPTSRLSAEEHQLVLDMLEYDLLTARVVEQQLRDHARTMEPRWNRGDVADINFDIYRERLAERRRQIDAMDATTNVVRLNAQRNARVRRARTYDVSGAVGATGLTIEQMLETDSPSLVAFALIKQHRDGRIWYDEFFKHTRTDWHGGDDGATIKPQPMRDEYVYRITRWLNANDRRLARITPRQVNTILDDVANTDKRNEPADWIASHTWDEVSRLNDVISQGFGAPDTEFNKHVGRCWFISMVARVMNPGCKVDTMPVFIGPQGARKSQALEVIGGDWYGAAHSNIDSKDFLMEMYGVLVLEVPELHSMLSSRQGAAKIKAVLSTRVDRFRQPYGIRVDDHKRTCVVSGTTNNREWHTDETGGRRFWPVHCGNINLRWLEHNRAQLFAEALNYYREWQAVQTVYDQLATQCDEGVEPVLEPAHALLWERGKWWNVPALEQEELMEAETHQSPMHDAIAGRLRSEMQAGNVWLGQRTIEGNQGVIHWDGNMSPTAQWGNLLTVLRIGVQWLGLSADSLGKGTAHAKTIGTCMRALGWEPKQVRLSSYDKVRAYVPGPGAYLMTGQDDAEGESAENVTQSNGTRRDNGTDENDIPF